METKTNLHNNLLFIIGLFDNFYLFIFILEVWIKIQSFLWIKFLLGEKMKSIK